MGNPLNPLQALLQGINLTPPQTAVVNSALTIIKNPLSASWYSYAGLLTGASFNTFSASKCYIGFEVNLNCDLTLQTSVDNFSQFLDVNNAVSQNVKNISLVWDSTGVVIKMEYNPVVVKNILFGRLISSAPVIYNYVVFNGILITY
jgi:hypothetical protein